MDPSFLALLAFLSVAVVAAALVLWPRFRESVQSEDPVVPEVLARLLDALDELAGDAEAEAEAEVDDPVYADLKRALEHDPRAVRRMREQWRLRLTRAGAPPVLLQDLDAL